MEKKLAQFTSSLNYHRADFNSSKPVVQFVNRMLV